MVNLGILLVLGSVSFLRQFSKIANFSHTESCNKNGVEFWQKSICAVRCSLATAYNNWQDCVTGMKLTGTDRQADRKADRRTMDKPRYWEACASKNVMFDHMM